MKLVDRNTPTGINLLKFNKGNTKISESCSKSTIKIPK